MRAMSRPSRPAPGSAAGTPRRPGPSSGGGRVPPGRGSGLSSVGHGWHHSQASRAPHPTCRRLWKVGWPGATVEHLRRGRQPRRAAHGGGRVRRGRPRLHRPALQHRQRLRVRRRHPRPGRAEPARGVGRDDAPAAAGGARGDERAVGDLGQHRRQRGGVPPTADGRGVRRGQLPGAGGGQPQPQGPAARRRVRDQPRVPAGLRPRRAHHGARREQHRDGGRAGLPAGGRRRAALPAPAAAQHQQEVQPGDRADAALPGVGRPARAARSGRRRSTGRSR